MQFKNDARRYGAIAQLFHWSIVVLVIVQYVLAQKAHELPLGAAKLATLAQHKSVGITILGLALLRLGWRWIGTVPPAPPQTPRWQRRVAQGAHVLHYALLIIIPLLGWLMSSARNFPVSWFGLITLPDFIPPSKAAFEFFHEAHEAAVNYIADPDSHSHALIKAANLVQVDGRRCFNPPLLVRQTRRDLVAEKLKGIAGLHVPATIRIEPRHPAISSAPPPRRA